ncbi:hypothetical protein GIB67_015318, partial [Kingdonia uniflora]
TANTPYWHRFRGQRPEFDSHFREYSSACFCIPGQNTPWVIALLARAHPAVSDLQVPSYRSRSILSASSLER